MLDQEYKYFKDNQKQLLKKYPNKVLVIKGEQIEGIYDGEEAAYKDAVSKFELGTFLIQRCVAEDKAVQTFHSRVIFP